MYNYVSLTHSVDVIFQKCLKGVKLRGELELFAKCCWQIFGNDLFRFNKKNKWKIKQKPEYARHVNMIPPLGIIFG